MSLTGQAEHLGMVLEAAPVAIVAADEAGRIEFLNGQAARLFGYERSELLGMSIENLVPQRFRGGHPVLRSGYTSAPSARPMGAGRDLFALRKDGSEMPVEIGLSPIQTSQGRFVLATVIDISERKRAEELRLGTVSERRRRLDAEADRDRAIDASHIKSQFVATMSHELRTPLNAIIGMAELLAGTELTTRQRNYVEKINASAEALLSIINSILDFSKIEAGKVQLEARPFELEAIVGGAADVLAQEARQKGLMLHTYVDPAIPPHLHGDAARLRQVLLNLIGNAIKFTDKGRVIVRIVPEQTSGRWITVRFEIDDSGMGIPSDVLPKLFEPFVQGDDSASRRFGGTGLGLSISKRIVALMGGEIHVSSRIGEGSQFWFTARFTVAAGVAPVARIVGVSALLAVEDETLAEILERYFSGWGVTSTRVRDAAEALRAVRSDSDAVGDGIAIVEVGGEQSSAIVDALIRDGAFDPGHIITIGPDESLQEPVRPSLLFDRVLGALSSARVHALGQPDGEAVAVSPTGPASLRVLVAEDNVGMHEVLMSQFEQLGVAVKIVSDGAQAAAAVQFGGFDLVFMDCQMPNVDGFEATRMIREGERLSGKHVPIIAMTANAFKEDRDACLAAGMDDHLPKPVRLREIKDVLRKWRAAQIART